MPRPLRLLLMILLWVILLGGGFVFYWIQDANRFKPQLEDLLETQTGVKARIDGDLGWRLWPPVSLTADAVEASYQGQTWTVGRLTLDVAAASLLRDPERWVVQTLTLDDASIHQHGNLLEVAHLSIRDFSPGRPAPVRTQLAYTPQDQTPVALTLDGNLTFDPDGNELRARQARIETDLAEGLCDLDMAPAPDPVPAPPTTADDLLPLDVVRGFDWAGTCHLDRLTLNGEAFPDVAVDLANEGGRNRLNLSFPEFFGGTAAFRLNIDATGSPVRWTLSPELAKVDSKRLLNWLDQSVQWLAPLAYGGTLQAEGNTEAELMASLSGETQFDGGQGSIDIAAVKQQILQMAAMLQAGDRIRGWPDNWNYERFVGNWRIDRQHHLMNFALDNLTVDAEGDYRPDTKQMDLLAELTFGNDPEFPVFDVDPLLFGLPIPVRCRGEIANPVCRLDEQAARRIVASALQNDDPEALRGKLEQKIDQEVPEEYREAARSLLDIFSRSLQPAPGEN